MRKRQTSPAIKRAGLVFIFNRCGLNWPHKDSLPHTGYMPRKDLPLHTGWLRHTGSYNRCGDLPAHKVRGRIRRHRAKPRTGSLPHMDCRRRTDWQHTDWPNRDLQHKGWHRTALLRKGYIRRKDWQHTGSIRTGSLHMDCPPPPVYLPGC